MLNTYLGQFSQPTSTGNQAVTGVGFQPKAVIFFWNNRTSDGTDTTSGSIGYGLATSSSNRVGLCAFRSTTSATARSRHDDSKCLTMINGSGTVLSGADLVTMDSDGFTINWTTADAVARKINFVALGGSDLTNAYIKQFTFPAGSGNQSHTGVGFQPDSMMLFSVANTTAPPNSQSFMRMDVGAAVSSSERAGTSMEANGTTTGRKRQRTNLQIPNVSNPQDIDFVSFDADGFTISSAGGTAYYGYALCLKGPRMKIGTLTQPTSTGNQAVTGVGFSPQVAMFLNWCEPANTSSVTTSAMQGFGAATSSSARAHIAAYYASTRNTNQNNNLDSIKCIKTFSTSALTSDADLVSMDSDGFTVNWTTADATSREIIYITLGNSAPIPATNTSNFFAFFQ